MSKIDRFKTFSLEADVVDVDAANAETENNESAIVEPSPTPVVGDLIECLIDVGNVDNSPWTQEVIEVTETGYKTGDNSGKVYEIPQEAFTRQYTSESGKVVFVVEDKISTESVKERPLINLEGFEDPEDHALFTLGLEADFINPHAEIITMETQQIEEEIKKRLFETVFLFTPTKPNIFSLGQHAIQASNAPEKTIFIINERDLDVLGDEANVARNVITMLKDQKVGIFSNMAEAKTYVQKQLSGDLIEDPEPEVVDVDALKDSV